MPAPTPWQVGELLAIRGFQLCFVPVVTPHCINLCHVKLAIVKREAMRRIQIVEHRHRALRLSGMFGIRKGEHFAVAHVCDQQHAARTERQHPRMRRGREHRNVKTLRQLQP